MFGVGRFLVQLIYHCASGVRLLYVKFINSIWTAACIAATRKWQRVKFTNHVFHRGGVTLLWGYHLHKQGHTRMVSIQKSQFLCVFSLPLLMLRISFFEKPQIFVQELTKKYNIFHQPPKKVRTFLENSPARNHTIGVMAAMTSLQLDPNSPNFLGRKITQHPLPQVFRQATKQQVCGLLVLSNLSLRAMLLFFYATYMHTHANLYTVNKYLYYITYITVIISKQANILTILYQN